MIIDGKIRGGLWTLGQCENLGITYAAGIFTLTGADGTTLSATNPGYACVPSTTAGQSVVLPITEDNAWTDGTQAGHTFLVDMFCGISDADWGNAMPWFLYLINTDNTASGLVMGWSRNPKATTTTSHANINFTDALGTQSQNNIIVNKAHVAGWGDAPYPCICIGSFTMIYDKAGHDTWEVQTLTQADGIGKFQEGVEFTFPASQNGNYTSYYWNSDATSDVPTYATAANIVSKYTISRDGVVAYTLDTTNAGNCTQDAGAGAVVVLFYPPYAQTSMYQSASAYMPLGEFSGTINNVVVSGNALFVATNAYFRIRFTAGNVAWAYIQEDNWGDNAADDVSFSVRYKAF